MNTSTPIKRIRFRGDSFQETEPLLDNDYCDEPHSTKNGEMPKEREYRGLFTVQFALSDTSINCFKRLLIDCLDD